MVKKGFLKCNAKCKIALCQTFSFYEINPRTKKYEKQKKSIKYFFPGFV